MSAFVRARKPRGCEPPLSGPIWPARCRGGGRHGAAPRRRGRLGHHGRAARRRQRRARTAREHDRDRRGARRADPDVRPDLGRALQSGGDARRRARRAGCRGATCRATSRRRSSGPSPASPPRTSCSSCRSSSPRARAPGGAQLLSEFVATFGLLAVIWGCARAPRGGGAVRRRRLHHRGVLVHRVHVVRESRRSPSRARPPIRSPASGPPTSPGSSWPSSSARRRQPRCSGWLAAGPHDATLRTGSPRRRMPRRSRDLQRGHRRPDRHVRDRAAYGRADRRPLAEKGDRFPTVVVERDGQSWRGRARAPIAAAPPTRAWPSIPCMSPGAHGARARGGPRWRRCAGPMRSAASGRSCPGSSPRTRRACTSRAVRVPGGRRLSASREARRPVAGLRHRGAAPGEGGCSSAPTTRREARWPRGPAVDGRRSLRGRQCRY